MPITHKIFVSAVSLCAFASTPSHSQPFQGAPQEKGQHWRAHVILYPEDKETELDTDGDGVPDTVEKMLLEKFQPFFVTEKADEPTLVSVSQFLSRSEIQGKKVTVYHHPAQVI